MCNELEFLFEVECDYIMKYFPELLNLKPEHVPVGDAWFPSGCNHLRRELIDKAMEEAAKLI